MWSVGAVDRVGRRVGGDAGVDDRHGGSSGTSRASRTRPPRAWSTGAPKEDAPPPQSLSSYINEAYMIASYICIIRASKPHSRHQEDGLPSSSTPLEARDR